MHAFLLSALNVDVTSCFRFLLPDVFKMTGYSLELGAKGKPPSRLSFLSGNFITATEMKLRWPPRTSLPPVPCATTQLTRTRLKPCTQVLATWKSSMLVTHHPSYLPVTNSSNIRALPPKSPMPSLLYLSFLPRFHPVPYAVYIGDWPSPLGDGRTFAMHLLFYLLLIFPSCSVRMNTFVLPIFLSFSSRLRRVSGIRQLPDKYL